jgi:hypothetical protein
MRMADHTTRDQATSFALTEVTLGGARLGPGTALIDDDVLRLLLLDAPTGDKSLQFRHDTILGAAIGPGMVMISCRDSRALILSTRDATALRGRLLAACRALPEVTRTLRALGSRRRTRYVPPAGEEDELRLFAPLIDARRASMEARDAQSVIEAFDPRHLRREIDVVLADFADRGTGGHPARRRAIEAELADDAEHLFVALDALSDAAVRAAADVDDLGRWRAWAGAVQRVFETADRAWVSLAATVAR